MTAITLETRQRLSKLIPRLATNHDGEVVATARAIDRTLKASGADFHDLAQAVGVGVIERVVYRDRPAPAPKEPAEPKTWAEIAKWCHERSTPLQPHERNFLADMAARLWGAQEPTPKQGAWLNTLHAKLRRASHD